MMCQDCQKRPAIIHFVSDINGAHQDLKLCAECAKKRRQAFSGVMSFAINMNDLLAGFYGKQGEPAQPELTCPSCGMTSAMLQQSAKLGCRDCYEVFHDWLEPVMRRIHGHTEHQGKIPGRGGAGFAIRRELEDLRRKQQAAIAEERFESAAELRDRIKALETQMKEEAAAQAARDNDAGADANAEGTSAPSDGGSEQGISPIDIHAKGDAE